MTQLPTIKLFGELYFVDNRLKQLRHTEDPHDYIDFNEFETMLQLSALSIKHSGGAEAHPELTKTLLLQATDYDRATGYTTAEQEPSLFDALKPAPHSKKRSRKLRM